MRPRTRYAVEHRDSKTAMSPGGSGNWTQLEFPKGMTMKQACARAEKFREEHPDDDVCVIIPAQVIWVSFGGQ